jgi:RNA polymerase sigma-70 factor, ECF subfamily
LELSRTRLAIPFESAANWSSMNSTSEPLSDAGLLRLSANGDEEAFTALYRRHQGSVFRFALHMSGRKEVAEEITQEVFLSLIRQPQQYRSDRGPLEAFLIGIARNKLRRHRTDRQVAGFGFDEAADTLASSDAPFDDCSKTSEVASLQAAILTLPPRYRELVVLCDLEEKAYAEAARLLGCPVGTVRSRLHRAHGILAAKILNREKCSA